MDVAIKKTKQKILLEAIVLFAARGAHGLRIDDVSQRAELNKRMIYHYFENKSFLCKYIVADQVEVVCGFAGLPDAAKRYLRQRFVGSFVVDPRGREIDELGNAARIILRESLEQKQGQLDLSMLGWRELYQRLVTFAVPFPAHNEGSFRPAENYRSVKTASLPKSLNQEEELSKNFEDQKPLLRIELSQSVRD